MRSVLAAVMAVALATGVTFAQQPMEQDQQQQQQQPAQQEQSLTATVQSVNPDMMMITVTDEQGQQAEYTLRNETRIVTPAGEEIQVGDLQPGSQVTIFYTGTRENPNITRVEVQQGMQQQQQ